MTLGCSNCPMMEASVRKSLLGEEIRRKRGENKEETRRIAGEIKQIRGSEKEFQPGLVTTAWLESLDGHQHVLSGQEE